MEHKNNGTMFFAKFIFQKALITNYVPFNVVFRREKWMAVSRNYTQNVFSVRCRRQEHRLVFQLVTNKRRYNVLLTSVTDKI